MLTPGQIRDSVPRCTKCQVNVVNSPGVICKMCHGEERFRRMAALIAVLTLCGALLVMGLVSAYGEWVRLNW